MIDIPKRAKDLLYSDTALKDYIIHFPNGEMADLTNENLVEENCTFTESICSSQNLTFGIVESPVIKFECVGVGNFKGCTIEVSITVREADDSYSYNIPLGIFTVSQCKRQADMEHRQVVAYAANINDDLVLKSDFIATLGYAWHAKTIPTRLYISSIEKQFFYDKTQIMEDARYGSDTVVQQREYKYSDGTTKFRMMVDVKNAYRVSDLEGMTKPAMKHRSTELHEKYDYYKVIGDFREYRASCEAFYQKVVGCFNEFISLKKGSNAENTEADVLDFFQKYTQDMLPTIVVDIPTTYTREKANYDAEENYLGGTVWGDYNPKATDRPDDGHFGGINRENRYIQNSPIMTSDGCVYNSSLTYQVGLLNNKLPTEWYHAASSSYAKFPVEVEFKFYDSAKESITLTLNASGIQVKTASEITHKTIAYELTSGSERIETSDYDRIDFQRKNKISKKRKKLTLDANHKWTSKETMETARKEFSSDVSSISDIQIKNIMASYAELQGKFGRINRYGQFEYIKVGGSDGLVPSTTLYPSIGLHPSGASAGNIYPTKYLDCWYEDLEIKQIGRIQCSFFDINNEGAETELVYDLVDDFSNDKYTTYIIQNNWLLNNGLYSEEDVLNILENMKANVKDIKYTTCSITMVGRPDIEVGDVILVTTEDGKIFETPVFRRTLSGIQLLRDKIEVKATDSVSGSSAGRSSSSVSGGSGSGFPGVTSVNKQTGAVSLSASDIPDDIGYAKKSELTYNYIKEDKKLILRGFTEGGTDD